MRTLAEQISAMPKGARIRPERIAKQAGISVWETLGLLRKLQEAGLGQIRLSVGDPRRGGIEVANFTSADEIPAMLEDTMGDEFEVLPEYVHVVFVPQQGFESAT